MYQFFWRELCDWYIELAKVGLDAQKAAASDEGRRSRAATQWTLRTVLDGALRASDWTKSLPAVWQPVQPGASVAATAAQG